jgi:hypothetical protein
MKVVINSCFGGFGLSDAALARYNELSGQTIENYYEIARNDTNLVQVVEELGKKADTTYSELNIVDIPDDVKWDIHEYDGLEHVYEKHRTWS